MDAHDYLYTLSEDHPDLYDWCYTLYDLYQRRLWRQLTFSLQHFIFLPVMQTGDNLIQLYHNFIIHFETEINPLKLAHIVTISSWYTDKDDAINFLKGVIEKLQSANQMHTKGPILYINMQIALFYLGKGEHKECKKLIDSGKATLESMTDIDDSVYSQYYWVSCQYHLFHQDIVEIYKNGVRFLAYASQESLPDSNQQNIAYYICITAMLGDNIYNIGELLEHPIIKSLVGSPYEWIYQMIEAFNAGSLVRYQELCAIHKAFEPALVQNEKKLVEKINILWLMEYFFRRSINDRTIPLTVIADRMEITVEEVEHLLLKSLSVHVIEGMIDGVDGTFHVSWVKPRVLGMNQIKYLRHRLANWLGKVRGVMIAVETFVAL